MSYHNQGNPHQNNGRGQAFGAYGRNDPRPMPESFRNAYNNRDQQHYNDGLWNSEPDQSVPRGGGRNGGRDYDGNRPYGQHQQPGGSRNHDGRQQGFSQGRDQRQREYDRDQGYQGGHNEVYNNRQGFTQRCSWDADAPTVSKEESLREAAENSREMAARKKSDAEAQRRREIEEQNSIIFLQATSTGADFDFDDDDDEGAPTMAVKPTVYDEEFLPPQNPQPDDDDSKGRKSKKERKREKKERKREKKEKKRRRHRSSSSSSSSGLEQDDRNASKKQRNSDGRSVYINEFDVRRNEYKLLKPHQYDFVNSHFVLDTLRDPDVLNHDRLEYAAKFTEKVGALSNTFKALAFQHDTRVNRQDEDRYFSRSRMANWDKCTVERSFRVVKPSEDPFKNGHMYLSLIPCHPDEEQFSGNKIKLEPDKVDYDNMTVDNYQNHDASQKLSFIESESNLPAREMLLKDKVHKNPKDVQAYLELIDIQVPLMALAEVQDENAPVQNTKALFERQDSLCAAAIKANTRSAELALKRIQVHESRFGPTDEKVEKLWRDIENKFINDPKMWELKIKTQQNDRSTFFFDKLNMLIDTAIERLLGIRGRTIKSHHCLPGTDEKLLELLVLRCQLQLVGGYVDSAVAMLQALTEWHLFSQFTGTKIDLFDQKNSFAKFWQSCVDRIGEPTAKGWRNYHERELHPNNAYYIREQEDLRKQTTEIIRFERKELIPAFKRNGIPYINIYRKLEMFRQQRYWSPIHYKHDDLNLFMYDSRYMEFASIEKNLFLFENPSFGEELIARLLRLFGVKVPVAGPASSMDTSISSILGQFSTDFVNLNDEEECVTPFPELHDFDVFMRNFLGLLLTQKDNSFARFAPAFVNIIPSGLEPRQHFAKLLSNDEIKKQPHYMHKIAYVVEAFEQYLKHSGKVTNNDKVFQFFHKTLNRFTPSVWELDDSQDCSQSASLRKLIFLRMLVVMVRNLPSLQDGDSASSNCPLVIDNPRLRRDLLMSLFVNGTTAEVEYSAENIQTAKENVVEHISCPGQKDVRMLEYAWFGNIAELTFELGLSFIYELGDAEYPNCHRIFFASAFDENDESTFHESLLAKSIIHSPAIHIFHVRVLEAILRRSSLYTPKRLNDKLKELIEQFPHEVFFLKKLIDRSTPLNARVFLQKNPGDKGDWITRRLRYCARIYLEHKRSVGLVEALVAENRNPKDARPYEHLIAVLKKAAGEESGDFIPDDYFWRVLIFFLQKSGAPTQEVHNQFVLGQKVCPWSKQLVIESHKLSPSSDNRFVGQITQFFLEHKLKAYILEREVKHMLEFEG